MNPELDFEAMPFETFDGFPTPASERSDVEAEGEFGRRSSWRRSRPSPMPRARFQQPGAKFQRSKKPATLGPRRPKKPPSRPSRFPRVRGRWPLGVIQEPYRVVTEPELHRTHAVRLQVYALGAERVERRARPPTSD